MAFVRVLSVVVMSTAFLFAQDVVPAGTILPVRLDTTLDINNGTAGQAIRGTIMQDVPLEGGGKLPAGTTVTGHLLQVEKSNSSSKLAFAFDHIHAADREVPILTNLRAMASPADVRSAQFPRTSQDMPKWQWTTVQIGGDVVYGLANRVEAAGKVVGRPVRDGVLVQVSAVPGSKCRGTVSGNDRPQALWVFSSGACGLYGFREDLKLFHAGRSEPAGSIVLEGPGKIHLERGTGLLLRVAPGSPDSARADSL